MPTYGTDPAAAPLWLLDDAADADAEVAAEADVAPAAVVGEADDTPTLVATDARLFPLGPRVAVPFLE